MKLALLYRTPVCLVLTVKQLDPPSPLLKCPGSSASDFNALKNKIVVQSSTDSVVPLIRIV